MSALGAGRGTVGSSAPGEAGPGAPAPTPGSAQRLGTAGPTEPTYSRHKAGGRDRGRTRSRPPTEPVLCPCDSLRVCSLAEGPPHSPPHLWLSSLTSPGSQPHRLSHLRAHTWTHRHTHIQTHYGVRKLRPLFWLPGMLPFALLPLLACSFFWIPFHLLQEVFPECTG